MLKALEKKRGMHHREALNEIINTRVNQPLLQIKTRRRRRRMRKKKKRKRRKKRRSTL